MTEVTCPKCGRKISAVLVKTIKGRRYVYVEHYLGYEAGKPKRARCYLGREENVDPSILALRGRVNRKRYPSEGELTAGLTVSLTPEEVEAFYVKVVEKVGKSKYDPKKHRGLS